MPIDLLDYVGKYTLLDFPSREIGIGKLEREKEYFLLKEAWKINSDKAILIDEIKLIRLYLMKQIMDKEIENSRGLRKTLLKFLNPLKREEKFIEYQISFEDIVSIRTITTPQEYLNINLI